MAHSLGIGSLRTRQADLTNVSVAETERIAQDIVAMNRIDRGSAPPPLADHFPAHRTAPRTNGLGQLVAQIKITSDALVVQAVKPKHRLRVGQIDLVLNLLALRQTRGVGILQTDRQPFQLLKCLAQGSRVLDALAFLLTVFGPWAMPLLVHDVSILFTTWLSL